MEFSSHYRINSKMCFSSVYEMWISDKEQMKLWYVFHLFMGVWISDKEWMNFIIYFSSIYGGLYTALHIPAESAGVCWTPLDSKSMTWAKFGRLRQTPAKFAIIPQNPVESAKLCWFESARVRGTTSNIIYCPNLTP